MNTFGARFVDNALVHFRNSHVRVIACSNYSCKYQPRLIQCLPDIVHGLLVSLTKHLTKGN